MAKRIYYYLIGFTIGAVFIYFLLLRGRSFNFWLPGERVKSDLMEKNILISGKALCQLDCLQENKDSIATLIQSSKVSFNKSRPRENPCRYYVFENTETKTEMEFSVCDTVVTLNNIIRAESVCGCDTVL